MVQPLVWLVLDDPVVCSRVSQAFEARGFSTESGDLPESPRPDVLVVEFPGNNGTGRERLQAGIQRWPRIAVVALCPHGMIEAGIAALKEGADDFLLLPFDLEELELRVERSLEVRRALGARRESERAGAIDPATRLRGGSSAMLELRDHVGRIARGRATVLITGETGTGKELVAGLIHAGSPRRAEAMVKVNCAALPDPLLESELFGHERGAFTGAEQRRIGRFEEADEGTLFLDEIGDMQLRTQAKVLRALQEQEFERLGGTRTIRVDVRVIAATNQDLPELIARGRFREDLFYRLNVVPVHLPPLREHPTDIPELAEQFVSEFASAQGRDRLSLAPGVAKALASYAWPGNVRELRNVLERAVLLEDSDQIQAERLSLNCLSSEAGSPPDTDPVGFQLPSGGIDYSEAERQLILQALERANWVQKDAADLLRMSRRKLNYRITRLGITHPGWRKNCGPA